MIRPQGDVGDRAPVVGAAVQEQAEVVVPSVQCAAGKNLDVAKELEAVFLITRIGKQVVAVCGSDQEIEAVTTPGVQLYANAGALRLTYPGRLKEAYSLPGAFLSTKLGCHCNGPHRTWEIC